MAFGQPHHESFVNEFLQQKKHLNFLKMDKKMDKIPQIFNQEPVQRLRSHTNTNVPILSRPCSTGSMSDRYKSPKPQLRNHVSGPIVLAITNSIHSRDHVLMDRDSTAAARTYYEQIVDNEWDTFHQKKQTIYRD
eukprot:163634_1